MDRTKRIQLRAIFLSYRRDDAEGEAGRLFDDLTADFGTETVFMDVAGIEPGRDFRKVIDQNVSSCGVLLAMIGKSWIDAKDEGGRRRLDDPLDFVRLETASALKRDIPVIPVLVQRGRMPRPEELPEDLKDLAYRNAVELTHARWDSDVQLLIKALRPHVGNGPEEGGSTKIELVDLASGEGMIPASEKAQIPAVTPLAPQPGTRSRSSVVMSAVVAIALAAGGLAVYEYKKAEEAKVRRAAAEAAAKQSAENERAAAERAAAIKAAAEKAVAEKVAAERAGAIKAAAEKAAAEKAATERAAAERAAAERAAAEKVAAERAAAERAAAERAAAAEKAGVAGGKKSSSGPLPYQKQKTAASGPVPYQKQKMPFQVNPQVKIFTASCTNLGSGRFSVTLSGDAYAPPGETYLLYTELIISPGGIRWRPVCAAWGAAQPTDGALWDVSCIHRPNDSPRTNWETTRTVTTNDGQPPPSGGIGTYKPEGGKGPFTEFNLTCQ